MKLALCDTNIVSLLAKEGCTASFIAWLERIGAVKYSTAACAFKFAVNDLLLICGELDR